MLWGAQPQTPTPVSCFPLLERVILCENYDSKASSGLHFPTTESKILLDVPWLKDEEGSNGHKGPALLQRLQ